MTYQQSRDELIPHAERVADKACGRQPGPGESREAWAVKWNQMYLAEMDRLAKSQRLTVPFREIYEQNHLTGKETK